MLSLSSIAEYCRSFWSVIRQFERETRPLVYVLLVIALLCACGSYFATGSLQSLSQNGLTELLGIMVTVFVVDQLLKQQEARAQLPLRLIAYRDVQVLISRAVSFWETAFRESVPAPTPATVAELFAAATFEKIYNELDIRSPAPVVPGRDWESYIVEWYTDFQTRVERILERYAGSLEPEVLARVHNLTDGMDARLLPAITSSDRQNNLPRPQIIAYRWKLLDTQLSAIIYLYDWCRRERKRLQEHQLDVPWAVPETPAVFEAERPLRARIDPNLLRQQYEAWHARSNKPTEA